MIREKSMPENKPKKGVFWFIEEIGLLTCPYKEGEVIGVSKAGDNYNHKLLWDHVKPKGCNKPFDYYPRGRVETNNRGKPIVYMNPNIGEDAVEQIMRAFDLRERPVIHYDGSEHYKCHMDRQ